MSVFSVSVMVSSPEKIAIIPELNQNTSIVHCSSKISDRTEIIFENATESAKVIKSIAEITPGGYGNFRFCAWANCKPGIPFFPASYHEGETAFAIGLESSNLVMQAFSNSKNLSLAEQNLKAIFEVELVKVEAIAQQISDKFEIKYHGKRCISCPIFRQTSKHCLCLRETRFW